MRSLNTDTIVAVFLLAICGIFFKATFDIQDLGFESMGAEVWPRVILTLLFVFSALYLFQSIKRGPPASKDDAAPEHERGAIGFLRRYQNAFYCYALFLVFLLTLDYLGMLLGGMMFVFLCLTALGKRSVKDHLLHAAIAVISVGAMWAIFTFGLRVILPEGEILRVW